VPGPLTKTVADAAIVLSVIAGVDKNDGTTVNITPPAYAKASAGKPTPLVRGEELKGLTIGLPKEYFIAGTDKGVAEAVEKAIADLKKLGVKFKQVSLPHTKYGVPVYYIITPSEVSSNLARFDGIKYGLSVAKPPLPPLSGGEENGLMQIYTKSRGKGFGPEAKRRIMLGTYALSAGYFDAYYLAAQKVRTKIKQELDKVLEGVDCLLTPTQPTVAWKIGEKGQDLIKMYLEDIFVTGASLAGLPAISIPCGFDGGMPVGLQLIGKRFDEARLFRVGGAYQQATEWHLKKPEIS